MTTIEQIANIRHENAENPKETGNIQMMPLSAIIRPIPSRLDNCKVERLKKDLTEDMERDDIDPIDVLHIIGSEGGHYFYAFGGCHRYAAYTQMKKEWVKVRLVPSTLATLRLYLGDSTPSVLK